MGLTYGLQKGEYVLGSADSDVTLTATYADNVHEIDTEGLSYLTFYVTYTTGVGETDNDIDIKIDGAPDQSLPGEESVTFFQSTSSSTSSGVVTLSPQDYHFTGALAGTEYTFKFFVPVADKKIKVSIKETGVAANFGTAMIKTLKSGIN